MKNKIIVLLFFVIAYGAVTKATAQTEIQAGTKTYAEMFDSLSTGLIRNRIPYGVLYDRVAGWSGLDKWSSNDTATISQLKQSWYDAEQSVLDSAIRPNIYSAMKTLLDSKITKSELPIVVSNFRFAYFDSLSYTDGRLSVNNGMLTDNNLATPYFTKQISIACIGLEEVFKNSNYILSTDTALIFNNTLLTIQNISVQNISTGTLYNLDINQTLLISFTQVGLNVLKFTINYTNGSSVVNNQIINVLENNSNGILYRPSGPLCRPVHGLVESTIPFKGYFENIATTSAADYHIYYHTIDPNPANNSDCERVLRKPIIIMDGFDPQDVNPYHIIYDKYLSYSFPKINLTDELRHKGYDVIILNFPKLGSEIKDENGAVVNTIPTNVKINGTATTVNLDNRDGGTDYIERNAFLLVKLIQQVNQTLTNNGSAEKLVIVGPSMGGQISRYALAYMEKQQSLGVADMNHNTRLFISFDSPNDGANIPLALAQNLNFFGNFAGQQEAKDKYDASLHSVAARQLLIEQLGGLNSGAPFHQIFYNNVRNGGLANSGGYPINLRKVALLNGNGNSIKTNNEGDKIFNIHGVSSRILGFIADDNFMPNIGSYLQIARTRLIDKKRLTIYNSWYSVTNQNTRGSMDVIQGSTFDANREVYNGFVKSLKGVGIDPPNILSPLKPNHCFIPSVSALGFRNTNFNWNDNLINRNLLCNSEVYFDGYFIAKTNEEHITLTTENVNWLSQEIDKGQPNCPTICSFSVNGLYNLCVNSTSTYSLDVQVPSGASTIWQPSDRYQIIGSTNNSVTISGTLDGPAIIKARIINPCGADVYITKDIYIGSPAFGATYKNGVTDGNPVAFYIPSQGNSNIINNVCIGYNGPPNVYIDAQPGGTNNVTWSVPNGYATTAFSLYTGYGNRAYFGWNYGGNNPSGYIQANVNNGCGSFSYIFAFKQINCGTSGGDPCLAAKAVNYFTISPNPANDNITIGIGNRLPPPKCNNLKALNTSNGIVFSNVNVYNNLGTLVKTYKTKNVKKATIPLSNLVAGSYQVEIIQDDYIEKQQIIVQK